jgi:hypothetical protein
MFKSIKLWFTDRDYYHQRKRYLKLQRNVRRKLRKQLSEFCPWSGYYMHEMIKIMLEFYHAVYKAKDCCWSESARLGKIEKSLAETLQYFDLLEQLDEVDAESELLPQAEAEPSFKTYLQEWSKENDMPVTDVMRPYLAYSFLEKIYTERLYNSIGKHIWEWCD